VEEGTTSTKSFVLPYAEEVNYWQTGKSDPDTWIKRTKTQLEKVGGEVALEIYGLDSRSGQAAYALHFRIGKDYYKVVWPVLRSRRGNERAAKIQAATMLYHDVKARCISAAVQGTRAMFLPYLLTESMRTVSELSTPEIIEFFPPLLEATLQDG
jgi:hypothetical protein